MVVRTLHQLTIVCALAAGCSKREPAPSGNAPSTGSAPATPTAPAAPAKAEPLKIAFAYVGPVGDAGWTFAHDKARKAVEAEFAGKVTTSFVENVPEAADAERVIRDMV